MALSALVMVFDVAVYFVFDSVEAVGDNSVVVVLSFEATVNPCHNNAEPASNESNENAVSHDTLCLGRCRDDNLVWVF
jgi:hypothetical protein